MKMTKLGEFIGSGKEGVVFRSGDVATKIFYNSFGQGSNVAKRELEAFDELYNPGSGINVPQPLDVIEVQITMDDIAGIKKRLVSRHSEIPGEEETREPESLVGKVFWGARREFIEGKVLYNRWIPSLTINRKLAHLYDTLERKGFDFSDGTAHNFVLNPGGEIYLIDPVSILSPSDKHSRFKRIIQKNLAPTSRFEEWMHYIAHFLTP